MAGRYAANTEVSPEKSRAEIERTLQRYGAGAFMYAWSGDDAVIQFRMSREHGERQVRFRLAFPDRETFRQMPNRYQRRTDAQVEAKWEQAVRQRWRALALAVKAKLEAVESGLFTFDQEFYAHIVLPDGRTVDEWLAPQLKEAYATGQMPSEMRLALPSPSEG